MNEIPKQPEPQDRIIFIATLTKDNKITYTINSRHIPTLAYIHKLIGVEIDKMIIDDKLRQMGENRIVAPPKGGIINFIRRGKPHAG